MSGDLEAAGAAITAGLAASTIDKPDVHKSSGHLCANCGAMLTGKFCSVCGQAGHVHRTLSHVFEEIAHGVLHFDGRAWRTLPMLAFRPGTLTGNYIFGMRARYISPVALFLFIVFAMFFVFSIMGGVGASPSSLLTTTQMEQNVATARAQHAAASADLAQAKAGGADPANVLDLEADVADTRQDLLEAEAALNQRLQRIEEFKKVRARLERDEQTEQAKPPSESRDESLEAIAQKRQRIEDALASPTGPPAEMRAVVDGDGETTVSMTVSDTGGEQVLFEEIKKANAAGRLSVNTGVADWDKKIRAKLDNPELAWYKIQNTAYKFAFLLVPLSLPFVAFLFLFKRDVTLYDHAVFVLYSLSFVCVLAIAVVVLSRWAPSAVDSIATSVVAAALPVHMFFQLKGGYGLSWWSALWRTLVLLIFSVICLSIFVVLIVLFGLVG